MFVEDYPIVEIWIDRPPLTKGVMNVVDLWNTPYENIPDEGLSFLRINGTLCRILMSSTSMNKSEIIVGVEE
jgi:hypothetical protein